jgi:hypothetical protein
MIVSSEGKGIVSEFQGGLKCSQPGVQILDVNGLIRFHFQCNQTSLIGRYNSYLTYDS